MDKMHKLLLFFFWMRLICHIALYFLIHSDKSDQVVCVTTQIRIVVRKQIICFSFLVCLFVSE